MEKLVILNQFVLTIMKKSDVYGDINFDHILYRFWKKLIKIIYGA